MVVRLVFLRVSRFIERYEDEFEHTFHEMLVVVTEHLPHVIGTIGH